MTTTTESPTGPETLTNRVALVTGSGRGIGQAIALQLSAAGARVAIVARSADELQHTVTLAAERGGQMLAQPTDVSDADQAAAALAAVAERWGPPPQQSAYLLLPRIARTATGQIWDAADPA